MNRISVKLLACVILVGSSLGITRYNLDVAADGLLIASGGVTGTGISFSSMLDAESSECKDGFNVALSSRLQEDCTYNNGSWRSRIDLGHEIMVSRRGTISPGQFALVLGLNFQKTGVRTLPPSRMKSLQIVLLR